MIAQDVGSAIAGPERGDIFFGSGEVAGALAGSARQDARFFILIPRE
jgi:membrane-bound lytic murein transglycosylase A